MFFQTLAASIYEGRLKIQRSRKVLAISFPKPSTRAKPTEPSGKAGRGRGPPEIRETGYLDAGMLRQPEDRTVTDARATDSDTVATACPRERQAIGAWPGGRLVWGLRPPGLASSPAASEPRSGKQRALGPGRAGPKGTPQPHDAPAAARQRFTMVPQTNLPAGPPRLRRRTEVSVWARRAAH